MHHDIDISIVTSVYQGAAYIEEFYSRITLTAQSVTQNYEVIFVNDGSVDASLELLKRLQASDPKVVVIDLSRNYGQHPALWVGLNASRGKQVFIIDCDLEESPNYLKLFHEKLRDEQADMVFASQKIRYSKRMGRLSGSLFYWALGYCTDYAIVPNVLMMRLMTREYVDAILQFKEHDPRMTIIAYLAGFKTLCVPIEKHFKGSSSYKFSKQLIEACDYIIGISNKPLRWILYGGCCIFAAAAFAALWLALAGVTSKGTWILCSLGLMTGLLMSCMGVVALYLGRVLLEVRRMPVPIIRRIYAHPSS